MNTDKEQELMRPVYGRTALTIPIRSSVANPPGSVMEAVTQINENFSWIVEVVSAKRQAVVQHHAAVCHIQSAYRHCETFSEILAEREINRCVCRQVV